MFGVIIKFPLIPPPYYDLHTKYWNLNSTAS